MVRCSEGVHNEMHRVLLTVVDWLRHLDGVKLLLEAPLLQVSHEHRQVLGGASQGCGRYVGAAILDLTLVGRSDTIIQCSLVNGCPNSMKELGLS